MQSFVTKGDMGVAATATAGPVAAAMEPVAWPVAAAMGPVAGPVAAGMVEHGAASGVSESVRCKILEGYFSLERVETVSIRVEYMPKCLPKCLRRVEYMSNTCRFDVDLHRSKSNTRRIKSIRISDQCTIQLAKTSKMPRICVGSALIVRGINIFLTAWAVSCAWMQSRNLF